MMQGTDEWHAERLGRVTASRIADVMMKPTTAGYQNYRAQLVCERLTGVPTEGFTSAAMQHGIETEPQARAMYTMHTGRAVDQVGFIPHPSLDWSGASPDGLVGETGLVEIKCPQPAEHIRMLTGGAIQSKYVLQMLWQMECTGRDWCDFVSFNPAFPDDLQLHVDRVQKDSARIDEIREAVSEFLASVDETLAKLTAKKDAA